MRSLLDSRAVQNVGKGRFETYYLVLDRQRRKRWTPLSGSDVKNAFWWAIYREARPSSAMADLGQGPVFRGGDRQFFPRQT